MKTFGISPLLIAAIFFIILHTGIAQENPVYSDKFGKPVPDHWLFAQYSDTITGSWSALSSLSQALIGVNSYYYSGNNKIFVCGGMNQQNVPQSNCYWYNISNDTYDNAPSLPMGRWSGKLVRLRDSLYLIGSIDSTFNSADGFIYRYSLTQNSWSIADTMPQPYLHECAVAVINDSLIVTIGGSTGNFGNAVSIVRLYNPWNNKWTASPSSFPVGNTTAHAECLKDTAYNIIVLGGYSAGPLNTVYNGIVSLAVQDSIRISWSSIDTLNSELFGQAIYRVTGAKWNDYAVFGPGMNGGTSVNQVWAMKFYNNNILWRRFEPASTDSAGNISTIAVKPGVDTNYFFMFGGFNNPNMLSTARKFSFVEPPPPPIGVIHTGNIIPGEFILKQNYPNPFNPETVIEFKIPEQAHVHLEVYDVLGRLVRVLVDEKLQPGSYKTVFNGEKIACGVYFYRLFSEKFNFTRKFIIIK